MAFIVVMVLLTPGLAHQLQQRSTLTPEVAMAIVGVILIGVPAALALIAASVLYQRGFFE